MNWHPKYPERADLPLSQRRLDWPLSQRRLDWRRPVRAVFVLMGASTLLAACGLSPESSPHALNKADVPYGLLAKPSPSTTTVPSAVPGAPVTLYLEGNQRLVPVTRQVAVPATPQEALQALAVGPTQSESNRGLVSPASSVGPVSVRTGLAGNGVVSVDLPVSFETLSSQDQIVAAAQLVFTLTAFSGINGVSFRVAGQPAQVPDDTGNLTAGPLTRGNYSTLVS